MKEYFELSVPSLETLILLLYLLRCGSVLRLLFLQLLVLSLQKLDALLLHLVFLLVVRYLSIQPFELLLRCQILHYLLLNIINAHLS